MFGNLSHVQAAELFLPTCLLMLGNQSMYQKFFSAKSEKDATRAVVGWFIGIVILETVIVAIAVLGSALFPTGEVHDRPREILAYTGMHGLPHVLGAIMVGAIFREGHFDRKQLSLFTGDEPGERRLRALHGA